MLWTVLLCVSISVAGLTGYRVGNASPDSVRTLSLQQAVSLEHYFTERSFSEIENTKEKLNALATQFLTELRSSGEASAMGAVRQPSNNHSSGPLELARMIADLQHGIAQFKGTEPEMLLVQELLWVYKRNHLNERWFDLYLRAVYEHPTASLIGDLAKEALGHGQVLGREDELVEAWKQVTLVPLEFPAKQQVRDSLNGISLARWGALSDGPLASGYGLKSHHQLLP